MKGTQADACHVAFIETTVFPWASSVAFGLLALVSLLAVLLGVARRSQFHLPWLRVLALFLLFASSAIHVGIGIVHSQIGYAPHTLGNRLYERLMNAYFATGDLTVCATGLLLLMLARHKSAWRSAAIVLLSLSSLACVAMIVLLVVSYNLLVLRVVWLCLDVIVLAGLLCSIQAAALNPNRQRERALLNAAAAVWIVRSIPEIVVISTVLGADTLHLDANYNSLYELFLELFPSILFLIIMWPRSILLQGGQRSRGKLDQYLREHGLSLAILLTLDGFFVFTFIMGFLSACASPYGISLAPNIGWAYYFSAATARVLAQGVPVLLFTVMFGSLTFLKSTLLRIVVPFERSVSLHFHVAWIVGLSAVGHAASTIAMGYTSYDLWGYASGAVTFACGLVATIVGLIYWVGAHSSVKTVCKISFPAFLWVHRVGFLMILVGYPVHIWPSLKTAPQNYILTYLIFAAYLVEILWRILHVSRSNATMRKISPDFYWLEVEVRERSGTAQFYGGQWVYILCPSISWLERHPFTIAQVDDGRERKEYSSSEPASDDGGKSNDNDRPAMRLLRASDQAGAVRQGTVKLRFLIKKCHDRGSRSWTHQLFEKLDGGPHAEPVGVFIDGPFLSPAMNLAAPSVKKSLLIGVGSGITSPLGIASARPDCYTSLVFVGRETSVIAQVVCVIRQVQQTGALRGGARLFLTAKNINSWPDEALLLCLGRWPVSWNAQLERAYAEFNELARLMWPDDAVPLLAGTSSSQIETFYQDLSTWRETHSFYRPIENVVISFGRPNWEDVLTQAQHDLALGPDTLSFVPEPLQINSLLQGSTILVDLPVLYCGNRQVLAFVEEYCSKSNVRLFENQSDEERMHLQLNSEVFG